MQANKTIISLTTIPSRIDNEELKDSGIMTCLNSLCSQDDDNYEVHFNVPNTYAMHDDKEYIIPDYINEYQDEYPNFNIFRVDDIGPPTKIVPTIERVNDPESLIIVADDDIVYHPRMIKEHLRQRERFPDCAIGYDGLNILGEEYRFNDARDRFASMLWRDTKVSILQHYKSVSYKRKFFEGDFFSDFVGKTSSDDVLVSAYMGKQGIDRMVPHYEKDGIYKDFDEWQARLSTWSFPMVRPTNQGSEEGTKDPLAKDFYGERFHCPSEFDKYLGE